MNFKTEDFLEKSKMQEDIEDILLILKLLLSLHIGFITGVVLMVIKKIITLIF